jgi:HJR/Mrr/RecB family endonuclease
VVVVRAVAAIVASHGHFDAPHAVVKNKNHKKTKATRKQKQQEKNNNKPTGTFQQ